MSTGTQNECPLCLEPFELDDISFFPCTCGYQICRFCWHRIRTDENGLCPACRKSYSESPAEFKPLAETDLQKLKKEKRQKDSQKKQKAAENRNHLANVRVVQKNLVFVVGLTQRLADAEVLKKHEYFGRFGKIHKIVINQSTSYAGVQGPSASAYVTYIRSEDAIRAIQAVNNITVDGRTVKASLGTTKYCSYFLRSLSCTKPDCMYLHELGDESASFTKEQIQQGKQLDYEQLLYDEYNQNARSSSIATSVATSIATSGNSGCNSSDLKNQSSSIKSSDLSHKKLTSARHQTSRPHVVDNVDERNNKTATVADNSSEQSQLRQTSADGKRSSNNYMMSDADINRLQSSEVTSTESALRASPSEAPDTSTSLSFNSVTSESQDGETCSADEPEPQNSWSRVSNEDDLEFDPWNESTKGLADMMEKENQFFDPRVKFFSHLNNAVPPNKALGLKQLPIARQNAKISPSSFQPQNILPSVHPDLQGWQNGFQLFCMKNGGNCEAVPPISGHNMVITNNNNMPQPFYQNYTTDQEKEWNTRQLKPLKPQDIFWMPGPSNMLSRHWNSSVQTFPNDIAGFEQGLRTQFGLPIGLVSNSRPDVQLVPPEFRYFSSVSAHVDSQSSLADSVD